MAIDLFKYLPLYYRESRIMKVLMDALGEEVRNPCQIFGGGCFSRVICWAV